jgi:hypothetical protein
LEKDNTLISKVSKIICFWTSIVPLTAAGEVEDKSAFDVAESSCNYARLPWILAINIMRQTIKKFGNSAA